MQRTTFRKAIDHLCRRYNILDDAEYLSARYQPAFSQLDEAGQRAFWQVLGAQEENRTEDLHALWDD